MRTSVAKYNSSRERQSDASALELLCAVQSLENAKKFFAYLGLNPAPLSRTNGLALPWTDHQHKHRSQIKVGDSATVTLQELALRRLAANSKALSMASLRAPMSIGLTT
jgi:hypothetical protein